MAPAALGGATLKIESEPEGAEILADKKPIGRTPQTLRMPISDLPVVFELRLPGYRKQTRQVVVTGNAVLHVPLERERPVVPVPVPRHEGSDTGLMRPE
jgi:hypothetical protein